MYAADAKKLWESYLGSEKKPSDFDAFWEKGFQEVHNLGTTYQMVAHDLNSTVAEAFDLYFTGVEGAKVHCQFVRPKHLRKKHPVLFQFHGYHSDSGDWSDKVALAAEGFWVVALDVRGQGGLSEDVGRITDASLKGHIIRGVESGPESLFYRSVFLDIYQLTRIMIDMPAVDKEQLYTHGASQGGALALLCAAVAPEIKEAFVCYPFLSDYREAYRLDVENSAYEELAYWFRFKDPLHQQEAHFFNTLDYIDLQYFAPSVQAKVFWGIGLTDTVCPVKTQFAVYNNLVVEKEMLFYPEYGHEYLPKFGDFMRQRLAASFIEKE